MYNFRYYAVGHSYLSHGPFRGWQSEGFWGMAATKKENDYFHRVQTRLKEEFDCNIEALAENHAMYERICVQNAKREDYEKSKEYLHIQEVITKFKPNVISLFLGGGNTIANDEKSLTQFFDVLYSMVAKVKRDDCVVVCPYRKINVDGVLIPIAKKYGFIPVDITELTAKNGRENPYYAYDDYPEYDELAKLGAVEFRTHPGDLGHDFIAKSIVEQLVNPIKEKIKEGVFDEPYTYLEYTANKTQLNDCKIQLYPADLNVSYQGFNIRKESDCVVFSSAPDTGASLSFYPIHLFAKSFTINVAVDSAIDDDELIFKVTSKGGTYEFCKPIVNNKLNVYEFDLSKVDGLLKMATLKPKSKDCLIRIKSASFELIEQ